MAALVTLNGLPVTHASISLPRRGVWHAQVALAQLEPFTGKQATLRFGPHLSLTGAVRRSGVAGGAALLLLLGGAGNLARAARPQAYLRSPLRLPLGDLLSSAEEVLSSEAHREVLELHLSQWVVSDSPIGTCIEALLAQAGAEWRCLPDGTFWVGNESWPETPAFEHVLLPSLPLDDAFSIHTVEPAVLPGQTFHERHVSYVEHHLAEDEMGTTVYLEAA